MDWTMCLTLPNPIGTYRTCLGLGLHGTRPFYGRRFKYLPLIDRTLHQVQVSGFNGLFWINVDERDIS